MSTTAPPQRPAPAIHVAGLGLCCAAGDLPAALLGAVGTNLTAAEPHASLQGIPPGKQAAVPLLTAPLGALPGGDTPRERIALLAENALAQAVARLPAETDGAELLVLMLVPGADSPRGRDLDHRFLRQRLAARPLLATATFRFHAAEDGGVEALQAAVAELAQGKWRAVLFGGADSLVDRATCTALLQAQQAMLQGAAGIVPGEGAAWLLLQTTAGAQHWADIGSLATADEPHFGQADEQKMTGLAAAVRGALQGAKLTPARLSDIVLTTSGQAAEALEWHQTVEDLWPRKDNLPPKFEEWRPYVTLGDTGAAALPLALALGCARFEFDYPSAEHVLVLETGSGAPRGALCLKAAAAPEQKTPQRQDNRQSFHFMEEGNHG